MLRKLLKYEMKASARTLIPLYIGTLFVALLCCIGLGLTLANDGANLAFFSAINAKTGNIGELIITFSYLLFFALCVAIIVLTAMIIVQRFNKSLIGDEGFLMFTLPVTHAQLLSSKLFAGMLWILIGTLVMGLSGIIMFLPVILHNTMEQMWTTIWTQFINNANILLPYLFSTLVNGLLGIAAFILLIYLCIMIAQTERFNQHRVAVAVILFFVISWIFGFVEANLFYGDIINLTGFFNLAEDGMWAVKWLMWAQAAYALVQCIICFFGTKWLMKRKLNL